MYAHSRVCVRVRVCVCVCVRERERERQTDRQTDRQTTERDREERGKKQIKKIDGKIQRVGHTETKTGGNKRGVCLNCAHSHSSLEERIKVRESPDFLSSL